MHREQIKRLLINNYQRRFKVPRNSNLSKILRSEVDGLMKTRYINQSDLVAVERKVSQLVHGSKNLLNMTAVQGPEVSHNFFTQPSPPHPAGKAPGGTETAKSPTSPTLQAKAGKEESESLLPPLKCGQGEEVRSGDLGWRTEDNWTRIMAHDLQKYAEEGRRRARETAERKHKVREELERQMQEKRLQKETERRTQLQYDEDLVAIGRGLEQQEQHRTSERLEHVRRERQLRDQQLRGTRGSDRVEEQERRRKEREAELAQERQNLLVLRTAQDEEQKEARLRRERQLAETRKLKESNDRLRIVHEERKKKAREEEKKELEEMHKALALQDKRRMEEKLAKEERMHALVAHAGQHIMKREKERQRDEEQRFLRSLLEREKSEQQREERRRTQHRERELNTWKYLDEQIRQKAHKVTEEKQRSKLLALSWRQDAEEYKKELLNKSQEVKRRHQNIYRDIMSQIEEKQSRTKKLHLMNEREFLINKQLIEETFKQQEKKEATSRPQPDDGKLQSPDLVPPIVQSKAQATPGEAASKQGTANISPVKT